MLDKSVKLLNVLMKRPAGIPILEYELPDGFSFHYFKPGDGISWADIEISVLEFDTQEKAIAKFSHYAAPEADTMLRTLFIRDDHTGKYIGTATIWWEYSGLRRDPWVSYVAIMPEYQGRGLSNALISEILKRSVTIEGDRNIYLHTQTWSHRAIRLYQKFGFYITDEPDLYKYKNDQYEEATALLNEIYASYPKR